MPAVKAIKNRIAATVDKLDNLFGRGVVVAGVAVVAVAVAVSVAALWMVSAAAPTTLTMVSGPKGSVFERYAQQYQKILARSGVKLRIVPTQGALDNLKKLADPKARVDVGFVLGGEADGLDIGNLMSLGSVAYQPLMVFYRGAPKHALGEFKGERVDIGAPGSGTHVLATQLLKLNGLDPQSDQGIARVQSTDPAHALLRHQVDAIFLMGDSASLATLRELTHDEDVHLLNFAQADGYTRRVNYLNKMVLPEGTLDFGRDIPPQDLQLIGPTVELVARKNLHPALSDLLLEAAREVHGSAALFRKAGEFPAPLEHEFRISPDALRYYASGRSYLYRTFPYWVASLITRVLAVVLPLGLILVPAAKVIPAVYRWRIESRLYRWYRVLLEVERAALKSPQDGAHRAELLRRLDHVEHSINRLKVPAFCGNLFYDLRAHIRFVRDTVSAAD
jgi:TRAP-type uncharacterized transport system substrate-binding protein